MDVDFSSSLEPSAFRNSTLDDFDDDVKGFLVGLSNLADEHGRSGLESSSNIYSSEADCIFSYDLLEPSPINTLSMRVVEHVNLNNFRVPFQPPLSDLFQVRNIFPEQTNPETCTSSSTFFQKLTSAQTNLSIRPPGGSNVIAPHATPSSPSVPSTISLTSGSSSASSSSSSCGNDDNDCMCHSDDLDNFADRWIERFQDLKRFVLKHGHCHVPIKLEENPALSKWAKRQRYQWKLKQGGKHSTLTDDRQVLLEDMGFLWDVRLSVWDQRFRELLLFRWSNGHCNVPLTCQRFSKLGTWVKCQRRQYRLLAMGRKSNMTPARIRQLNDLGFAWKGRDGSSALCGTEGDDAASSMSTKKTTE